VLGVVHTLATAAVTTVLAAAAAIVAAYIMYGRIISDPLILLKIILRLIGFGELADSF
jgi:hypothetical protein